MPTAGIVADYLELMIQQRDHCFALLEGVGDEALWWRPAPGEWSIGENLDHLRVFNASMLRIFRIAWTVLQPWARLRWRKPYEVEIENHYARPNFPMKTGWIWPPRRTPAKPVPFAVLKADLVAVHEQVGDFYGRRDPDLLGHVNLYDPVMGWMNLIQALRESLYHDELHYDVIDRLLAALPATY